MFAKVHSERKWHIFLTNAGGWGCVLYFFFNVICLLFFKRLKGSHTNDVRCLVWYVNQFVESITTALKRTSLSIFNIVKLFDALYRTFVPKSLYSFTGIDIYPSVSRVKANESKVVEMTWKDHICSNIYNIVCLTSLIFKDKKRRILEDILRGFRIFYLHVWKIFQIKFHLNSHKNIPFIIY